jgi:uncharacterized membrane protein YeaQ/YmgE (transglycosylase-associated protein family)
MGLSNIIVWILLGAVAGWAAGQLTKGKGLGTIRNIMVGIIGSFLGGWIAGQLGITGAKTGGLSIASFATAIAGASILLYVIELIKKK